VAVGACDWSNTGQQPLHGYAATYALAYHGLALNTKEYIYMSLICSKHLCGTSLRLLFRNVALSYGMC